MLDKSSLFLREKPLSDWAILQKWMLNQDRRRQDFPKAEDARESIYCTRRVQDLRGS